MATIQIPIPSISYTHPLKTHFKTTPLFSRNINTISTYVTLKTPNKSNNSINNNARKFNCFTLKPISMPSSISGRSSIIVASAAVANGGSTSYGDLERYLLNSYDSSYMMTGSFGSSNAVTLQRPKPELNEKTLILKDPLDDLDHTGDGGNGNNKVGGGDNGGGGFGDDDDYFDDFDDNDDDDDGDEGGFFRRRIPLKELYDMKFVESVLKEWQKTLKDLPEGMRLACEMGIISSAQLVKYLMNEARPTITRTITRALSKSMSRAFRGRIIADPAFLHKLLFEEFVTVACSVRSELKRRGERIRQEWDLALMNVVAAAACNLVVVWSLAPCNSYVNTFSSHLQNTLTKLPNNMFESSYRYREFDVQKRIQSFVCRAVQFSLVGFIAGAVQSSVSNLCAKNKDGRLSVKIPPAKTNALGYGAFLGLYTNLRYQMLCGMDSLLSSHFDVIGVSLLLSAAFRFLNAQFGEVSRAIWLDAERLSLMPVRAHSNKVERRKRIIRKKVSSFPVS